MTASAPMTLANVFDGIAYCIRCRTYTAAGPAHLCSIVAKLPAPERWPDGGPTHTHQIGPLCQPVPLGDCDHGSCMMQLFESCQACYVAAMDGPDLIRCGFHGDQEIAAGGSAQGYAGGRIYWLTLSCGCTQMDESGDVEAAY